MGNTPNQYIYIWGFFVLFCLFIFPISVYVPLALHETTHNHVPSIQNLIRKLINITILYLHVVDYYFLACIREYTKCKDDLWLYLFSEAS